jgi:hypothetical protein
MIREVMMKRLDPVTVLQSVMILLLGAVIGAFSGYVFVFAGGIAGHHIAGHHNDVFIIAPATLLPGTFFGVGLSTLCLYSKATKIVNTMLILLLCTFCYCLAFHITYYGFMFYGAVLHSMFEYVAENFVGYASVMFSAFCAGFITTYLMMYGLNGLVGIYSKKVIRKICWVGAIIAGALIVFPLEVLMHNSESISFPLDLNTVGTFAFFIVWQSVILVAVGSPLVNRVQSHKLGK